MTNNKDDLEKRRRQNYIAATISLFLTVFIIVGLWLSLDFQELGLALIVLMIVAALVEVFVVRTSRDQRKKDSKQHD